MGLNEPAWRAKAKANLLEARRKNGRLGARKSRSGCISCKERRVKCGEERPACRRCVLAGRRCEGYDPLPSRTPSTSPPIEQNPSLVVPLRQNERRTYDFFLARAAPHLAGPLDKDFWCGYVLQLTHVEPLVTDCLLAISTLYEHPRFMASFRRNPFVINNDEQSKAESYVTHPNVKPPLDKYHASALQKYNKAILQLRDRIEQGSATPVLVLTSCALFFCIEVIRDNFFAALALIKHGVGVLEHYASLGFQDHQLFKTVRLMFSRIGVTAATIGRPVPGGERSGLIDLGERSVFDNMTDARDALFGIMSESHTFMRETFAWKKAFIAMNAQDPPSSVNSADNEKEHVVATMYGAAYRWTDKNDIPAQQNLNTLPTPSTLFDDDSEDDVAPDSKEDAGVCDAPVQQPSPTPDNELTSPNKFSEMHSFKLHLLNTLDTWLRIFQATQERIQRSDPQTHAFLHMYFHSTYIWVSTRLHVPNLIFDQFTFNFEQIVRHAEIYLSAQAAERATFTFESGAVAPLFLTATCCRVPSLRRRALDLMSKAPRKESFHGAESTAEMASQAIAIEEEGLGLPTPDTSGTCYNDSIRDDILPTEEQRIHYLELMKNMTTQRHEMIVTRYSVVDDRYVHNVQTYPI